MDGLSSHQSLKSAVRSKPELKAVKRFSFGEPILVLNFRKFLPLVPPSCNYTMPEHIREFLLSRDYGMLSLEQQEIARQKIELCYSGHYSTADVTEYLAKVTKLEISALYTFASTYGRSHDVIDWYRLIRTIYRIGRLQPLKYQKVYDKNTVARRIQNLYRKWRIKHRPAVQIQSSRKEVSSYDKNPYYNDLLIELRRKFSVAPYSLKGLFEAMDKNGNGEISKEYFDQAMKDLEVQSSPTAVNELFKHFDQDDRDFFSYPYFLSLLFHTEVLRSKTGYLNTLNLLLQELNIDLRYHFASLKDFELDFKQYYYTYKEFNAEVLESYFERLLKYNKYSRYQLEQVFRFVGSEKFIGKLYTWRAEDMKKVTPASGDKNVVFKEIKNKQLQALVAIAYFLLDRNDLKDKSYSKEEFVEAAKEVSGEQPANIFFTLFKGINKLMPYYLNSRLGVAPISARLYRENSPKELRELQEDITGKYSATTVYTGKHLGMIIYENLQDRMTDLDYKALGVELKGEYNMHAIIKQLFDFKMERISNSILHALAKKVYWHWKKYKLARRKSLKLGLDLLGGTYSSGYRRIMSLVNEPSDPASAKNKLKRLNSQRPGEKKSARSVSSTDKPKSEFYPDAIKFIHSLIDGLSARPVKPPVKQTAIRHYLYARKLHEFSYRTNLTHFSTDNLVGGVFMSDSIYTFNEGEKKEIRLEGFLRPNNQVLDFLATEDQVVVLRSSLHLDFYDIQATDNFPRTSIKLTNGSNYTNEQLNKLHRHRLYNKYPYLLKHQRAALYVNITGCNNRIYKLEVSSGQQVGRTKFLPEAYTISSFQNAIINEVKAVLIKRQMTPTQVIQLNQFPMSRKAFKHLLTINFPNLEKFPDERKALFELLEVSGDEVSMLQGYFLRSLLSDIEVVRYLPERFEEPHYMLHDYLLNSNMSLLDLMYELDDSNAGHITYKSFKNLLQKLYSGEDYDSIEELLAYIDSSGKIHYHNLSQFITAVHSAQLHQDEIKHDFVQLVRNSAITDLTIEKCRQLFFPVFQYNSEDIAHFLETLTYTREGRLDTEWFEYYSRQPEQTIPRLWQRPRCPIEDFTYIEDYRLLVHTVAGHNCIFIGEDVDGINKILAVLTGQHTYLPPVFQYLPQSTILVSGDRHTGKGRASSLYIWNLQSLLVNSHALNPPWTLSPTKVVTDIHSDSISCLSFASYSGILITASLDSTIKCWTLDTNKQELEEVRRFYQDNVICIGCSVIGKKFEKSKPLYTMVCLSVEKMINRGNRNQIAANAEYYCLETLKVQISEDSVQDEIPLKLRNELDVLGNRILEHKQKASKIRSFELQKEARTRRHILGGFSRQFFRSLKRYMIFGEEYSMQKVFSWMRQIYQGVTLSQFRYTLTEFGIRVHMTASAFNEIRNQLSFVHETRIDLTSLKNDLPLSMLLPTITPESKQKIKRYLDRLHKDGLTESEFYEIFTKAQVGTPDELRTYFEMAINNNQSAENRLVPVYGIYKSVLKENPKPQTPAAALRKLSKHLRKHSIEPWKLFSYSRYKLAYYRYQLPEEFKAKLVGLKALADNEIQLLLNFFENPKGVSLKRFVDCLVKASYFIDITANMGATVNFREGSVSPRERRSTLQAGSASPRELDVSEYRSVYVEDRNFSQISDIDPHSIPIEEGGTVSNKPDGVPLTFKGKNLSILNRPNLTRLREQLANDPIKLKKLLAQCQKLYSYKGRIEEAKFRELLYDDHTEDELEEILKEITDFYGNGPIDYETVLPQMRSDSDLELLCCQLYECLRHNTLNISQKEYLKMFKIEEINKTKIKHLLKKLKLTVTLDMEEELVKYLNCVRAISVEEFLRKIHPKQYPKPNFKNSTAYILLQEREGITEIIIDSLEEAQDFNLLQHVPFSLLKNTIINPKYQLNNTYLSALEDYLRKLRKEEYKFIPNHKESYLYVSLQLFFDQLSHFLNPNADTHSMSSSSLSMSKDSAPKDLRRKSEKNIGQSQASNTSELSQRINDIVHRGQAKLKEKGKSIWEVLSAVQPDWMEGYRISKQEFFRVFDSIDAGLRLREKVELLRYCDREKSGEVDIDLLLEAFYNKHLQSIVDRFILTKVAQLMELRELKLNRMIAEMLGDERLPKYKITPYEISQKFGEQPFFFPSYVLKELFRMLSHGKKLFDDEYEVCEAFTLAFKRCGIELHENTSDLVPQLCSYLDVGERSLEQLLPINSTGKANLQYLVKCLSVLQPAELEVEQLWKLLIDRLNLEKKLPEKKLLSFVMPHADLLKLVRELVQNEQFSKTRETSLAKRIVKAIEHRQLSLFYFFLLVDKARKGSVSELEFNNGLRELGIFDSVWRNLHKRNPKWLTFSEFIHFLIKHEACDISIADTDLEVAMSLFIKKVLKQERVDKFFQKLSQLNGQPQEQATWQTFHQYLETLRVLKPEQEQLIFSALVHADQLSRVRLGNDALLKNEDNLKKGFSYRQLIRLYYHFTRKNIKKTALFKLQEALLKRRLSLFQEMMNFMQTNRKIKDIGELLKNKELALPRQYMAQFLTELNTGLNYKDIKECLLLFDEKVAYNDFQLRLERIYQSASNDAGEQEALLNARRLYDCINGLGSSSERLFQDFDSSRKNCMILADFNELCGFVNCGLNKIQVKEVFEVADEAKKGHISSYELSNLFYEAMKVGDRPEEKIEVEEIVFRVMAGRTKLKLPAPITLVTDYIFTKCFEPVLNPLEVARLQSELRKKHGKFLDGQKLLDFIEQQVQQSESKTHRKARSLIKRLLVFFADYALTVKDWYRYFTQGNFITKSEFFTLMQTLPFKLEMDYIDDLFSYIDESRAYSISLEALSYKIDVAVLSNEGTATQYSTKLYYKTKQKLQYIYMHFVRKLFRDKQIYSFFDTNGTGEISGRQLLVILQDMEISMQDNYKNKLVKYLAKDEAGTISVSNLLRYLKSCLPNQTKEVLETKIYQIFKQHQDAIQEQPELFIDRLLDGELEVRHTDSKNREIVSKGIREKDLFNILKEFGVLLTEEELQDVRANFGLGNGHEYLDLEKLYALIDSVLSGTSKHEKSLQVARYAKLLRYFKSKNITFRQIESIVSQHGSARGLMQVLQSLHILRPIEVKRLVDPLVIAGTTQVDLQLFKDNLLSSYYGYYKERMRTQYSETAVVGDSALLNKLKYQLMKRNSNSSFWLNELSSRSALLSKESFEQTLVNSGVILSKKDINAVLRELSDEKGKVDKLKVSRLMGKTPNEPVQQFKQIEEVNENEHHDRIYQLLDHVSVSVNYKGASLLECLRECGCSLEGKCPIDYFMEFLKRTGCDESLTYVQYVLSLSGLPTDRVEAQALEKLMVEMGFKLNRLSDFSVYRWVSSAFKAIAEDFERNQIDIAKHAKSYCDREEMINWEQAYKLLRKMAPAHYSYLQTLIHFIFRYERLPLSDFLDELDYLLKGSKDEDLPNDNPQLQLSEFCHILEKSNPLRNTENSIERISAAVESILSNQGTTVRGMKLIANSLLAVSILEKLEAQEPVPLPTSQQHATMSLNFFPIGQYLQKPLILEEVRTNDQLSYFINYSYIGFKDLKLCEDRLKVYMILRSNSTMYTAENFYCLPLHKHAYHCSGAININWPAISQFGRLLLQQINTVHRHGYCLMNLRWKHLSQYKGGLVSSDYPCRIDNMGRLAAPAPVYYDANDAYVSPELLYGGNHDFKIDTWSFGCLMVRFVFGCDPESIHLQIPPHEGKVSELPTDFSYLWLSDINFKRILCFEHYNTTVSVADDIFDIPSKRIRTLLHRIIQAFRKLYSHLPEAELELSLKSLHELLGIINMCLSFNPEHRPTIGELLALPVFQYNKNLKLPEVLNGLSKLVPVRTLRSEFEQLKYKYELLRVAPGVKRAMSLLEKQANFLKTFLQKYRGEYLPDNAILLKMYRKVSLSESVAAKIYSYRLTGLNVQNGFINYIFNTGLLKSITIEANRAGEKVELDALLALLVELSEQLKRYASGLAYYTVEYLMVLLMACLGQLADFLSVSPSSEDLLDNLEDIKIHFNAAERKSFIDLYKKIIGSNGQPTIEYLPIYETITASNELQEYFHAMYVVLALYCTVYKDLSNATVREDAMAKIEFLTQTIGSERTGQSKAMFDGKCPALLIFFLKSKDYKLREKALQFYLKLSASNGLCEIFKRHSLYIPLFGRIRSPDEPVSNKSLAIQTMINLLDTDDREVLSNLNDCCYGGIEYALRLSIEPLADSPERSIYQELKGLLSEVAIRLRNEDNPNYARIVAGVPGSLTILYG